MKIISHTVNLGAVRLQVVRVRLTVSILKKTPWFVVVEVPTLVVRCESVTNVDRFIEIVARHGKSHRRSFRPKSHASQAEPIGLH